MRSSKLLGASLLLSVSMLFATGCLVLGDCDEAKECNRTGKTLLCHQLNDGTSQAACVSDSAVSQYLESGDYLGCCDSEEEDYDWEWENHHSHHWDCDEGCDRCEHRDDCGCREEPVCRPPPCPCENACCHSDCEQSDGGQTPCEPNEPSEPPVSPRPPDSCESSADGGSVHEAAPVDS